MRKYYLEMLEEIIPKWWKDTKVRILVYANDKMWNDAIKDKCANKAMEVRLCNMDGQTQELTGNMSLNIRVEYSIRVVE